MYNFMAVCVPVSTSGLLPVFVSFCLCTQLFDCTNYAVMYSTDVSLYYMLQDISLWLPVYLQECEGGALPGGLVVLCVTDQYHANVCAHMFV